MTISTSACVYRAFDVEGTLLYVGQSMHPSQRLYTHARGSRWWPATVNITVEHFASREEAVAAEALAIRREHPLLNVTGNRGSAHRALRPRVARVNRAAIWTPTEEQKEILARLRRVTAKVARSHRKRDAAREARDEKIREALGIGMTRAELAALTGLSLPRLDQIRRRARL